MKRFQQIGQEGFSFMELMAAIVIGAIVLAATTTTFMSQTRSYDAQEQVNEMQQRARAAMDMIARELRMAGYDPTDAGGFDGVELNVAQLRIQADLNEDGDTGDANEDITYAYDAVADVINRTEGGTTEAIVDNIDTFTLAYFKDDGTAAATAAEIRQVQITIQARTAKVDPNFPQNGGIRTYTLRSMITPRNLAL